MNNDKDKDKEVNNYFRKLREDIINIKICVEDNKSLRKNNEYMFIVKLSEQFPDIADEQPTLFKQLLFDDDYTMILHLIHMCELKETGEITEDQAINALNKELI